MTMLQQPRSLACAAAAALVLIAPQARAQNTAAAPQRPTILMERWEEDWSVLDNPAVPREPLDGLKYIRLGDDPERYLSLGATIRERVESLDAAGFGTGHRSSNTYLLDRVQLHTALHIDGWQVFVQVEDDRAPWKTTIGPADTDRFDLEQGFVAHVSELGGGVLKLRVGRQEFGFDLQRFVSVRDGPNVRQAYDALWADYEIGDWRVISFGSHPTQYRDTTAFDDFSAHNLALHGFRVERRKIGPGDLAVYYLRYENGSERFAGASGRDERNAVDLHYTGVSGSVDFDLEAMGQQGSFAGRPVLAWAFGGRTGYTFRDVAWSPHPFVQIDLASGNTRRSGTFGTFNPLFPNGYYFPLAGLTTYANLIHLKPAITVSPTSALTLQAALGLQWRATTRDAVFTIPAQPVPNTAGRGTPWTAAYLQLVATQKVSHAITVAAEVDRYQIGSTLRAAGGHDATYAEIQVTFAW